MFKIKQYASPVAIYIVYIWVSHDLQKKSCNERETVVLYSWTKRGKKNEILRKTYASCNCSTCTNYCDVVASTMGELLYKQGWRLLL